MLKEFVCECGEKVKVNKEDWEEVAAAQDKMCIECYRESEMVIQEQHANYNAGIRESLMRYNLM